MNALPKYFFFDILQPYFSASLSLDYVFVSNFDNQNVVCNLGHHM